MVAQYWNQMSGIGKVSNLGRNIWVRTQHTGKLMACFLYCMGAVFILEAVHWQDLSEGYWSTNNRLRIRWRMEWMVSILIAYLHQRLLAAIINFWEHVYMRPEVNSNRFYMSLRLHDSLHGDFTASTFQTIARLYCTCANDKQMLRYWLFFKQ